MPRWVVTGVLLAFATGTAAAAAGKDIYDKQCASCHGADGHGSASKAKVLKIDASLLDLGRPEARGISRDEKKKILLDGKAKMPGYATKIAAADIDPVLDYCLGLVASDTPAAPAPAAPAPAATAPKASPPSAGLDVAKAKAAWKKSCLSCHGAEGQGKPSKARSLKLDAGTLDLGRDAARGMTRDEKRAVIADGKGKMPAFAKKLGAAKVELLTDYAVQLAARRAK